MERRALGRSGLAVPKICLGTMTWGEQNSEQDGFAQMDFALDRGVDFFDTAEMYPIAPRAETYGRTEEIIGKWLRARCTRDKIVLATKVTGPDTRFLYMRDGKPRLNRKHIVAAIDGSLKRLQTDYVDLYQLHWPDRTTNAFGQLGYEQLEEDTVPLEESLAALAELVTAGKVRYIGVSNETPWGLMRYLALSDAGYGPRMVSIQNPYSLLNRSFDVGLAEVALREDCGLLAYAPVAAGVLTGKYLNGARPPGARMTLFPNNRRYLGRAAEAATADYVELAHEAGLDPARMALAFVLSRPFVTSAIVGATSIPQFENALAAADVMLSAASTPIPARDRRALLRGTLPMRLFVALDLPEPERRRLTELANGLPGARWVAPENLHLTLRFVGEVDGRDAQDIDSALSGLRCERFTLSLNGVGHFSEGQKPRQLWVGVEAEPILQRLQAKVEQAVQRAGQPPERRKFKPHVTLARLRDAPIAKMQDFLTRHALYRSAPFVVGEFLLYSSFLTDNGPIYRVEAEYPLLPAENGSVSADPGLR